VEVPVVVPVVVPVMVPVEVSLEADGFVLAVEESGERLELRNRESPRADPPVELGTDAVS
jgi:hypothetical protein